MSGFIYPIFGHWIWGPDGWLATDGRRRSVTSPARPSSTPSVACSPSRGAIALGPRLGRKFKRDGGGMPPGHNMTLAALGAVILWFGWYGFNPGSTLSAMDFEGIGRVATNTTLAACAGALVAVLWVYPRSKKWDVGISINGLLAGLVAITVSVLLGVADRRDRHRCDRRRDHGPRRSTSPSGSGSTTPAVRSRCTAPAASSGTLEPRVVRHRQLRHPAFGAKGTLLRRRHRPAGRPDHGQRDRHRRARSPSVCSLMFGIKAIGMLRISEDERARGSRHPRARCAGVPPGVRVQGYSPIPSNMEGVAPGIAATTVPPSDIHLPTSD